MNVTFIESIPQSEEVSGGRETLGGAQRYMYTLALKIELL